MDRLWPRCLPRAPGTPPRSRRPLPDFRRNSSRLGGIILCSAPRAAAWAFCQPLYSRAEWPPLLLAWPLLQRALWQRLLAPASRLLFCFTTRSRSLSEHLWIIAVSSRLSSARSSHKLHFGSIRRRFRHLCARFSRHFQIDSRGLVAFSILALDVGSLLSHFNIDRPLTCAASSQACSPTCA
jgi:hypothetical protein